MAEATKKLVQAIQLSYETDVETTIATTTGDVETTGNTLETPLQD